MTREQILKAKFKITIIEGQKWKAIISIDFGWMNLKGYRIWDSEYADEDGEYLWVTPPCYRSGPRFVEIVFIQKSLWKELKKLVREEYKKALEKHAEKKLEKMRIPNETPIEDFKF